MTDECGFPISGPHHAACMFRNPCAVPLFKGARAQMAQASEHHAANMALSREQMAMQQAIAKAQLELANKPIPTPDKPQPGVTETSADVASAEAQLRAKKAKQGAAQTVRGGSNYRGLRTGGTSAPLGAKAA